MPFLRRLVRTLVVLALFFLVLGVVVVVLGRPFVERIAARSIEDRLGTPVSVSIELPVSPAIARGDVGKVTVKADQFERNGLELTGARAVYHGVRFHLSDLVHGDVRLRYASVNFQGTLTQASLRAYLKPLLVSRGVPAKHLMVLIHEGDATLRAGSLRGTVRAKVIGGTSIQLIAVSGSSPLVQAFKTPIQLGPLPDGVTLTGIVLTKGQATIVGRGEAGTIDA